MHCVFIHGPIASGKLTVAKELQKLSGLPIHHNHFAVDAALSLFQFGSDSFIRLREQYWKAAFTEATHSGQSFIFTFAPEATVRRTLIDELVKIIELSGGRVLFVELVCDEEEIERRIVSSDRSSHGKLTSLEEYRKYRELGAFKFPAMPVPLITLGTSELSANAVAAKICEVM